LPQIAAAESSAKQALNDAMAQHCPLCSQLAEMRDKGDWEGSHELMCKKHFLGTVTVEGHDGSEATGGAGANAAGGGGSLGSTGGEPQGGELAEPEHPPALDDGTLVRTNPDQEPTLKEMLKVGP